MQTIGLIGCMSWQSSAVYYRLINEAVQARRGAGASAECIMVSPNFAPIERLQHQGQWDVLEQRMVALARQLEGAGADCIVLCTNTMHRFAGAMAAAVHIAFLHIADATARPMAAAGIRRVGLLGTRFTMEQDFYRERLRAHGIQTLIPPVQSREAVHRIIYDELVQGVLKESSRDTYRAAMAQLAADGAEAVVLGCTEIMLLVGQQDCPVPLFDTTALHAQAAVDFALAKPCAP